MIMSYLRWTNDKLGLPTGFSFQQGGGLPEKQKKGDKKTFYCEICLIELNSLDTMKSHVSGVSNLLPHSTLVITAPD